MKVITYKCNFCGTASDKPESIIGLWWGHNTLEMRSPREVENHLCKTCLKAIQACLLSANLKTILETAETSI